MEMAEREQLRLIENSLRYLEVRPPVNGDYNDNLPPARGPAAAASGPSPHCTYMCAFPTQPAFNNPYVVNIGTGWAVMDDDDKSDDEKSTRLPKRDLMFYIPLSERERHQRESTAKKRKDRNKKKKN